MTDAAPWYYPIYIGPTRQDLDQVLGPAPFKRSADQMVEMLLHAGYGPDVLDPSREPLQTPGVTTTVRREGRVFLVSIDEASSVIAVQEVTDEAYPDE